MANRVHRHDAIVWLGADPILAHADGCLIVYVAHIHSILLSKDCLCFMLLSNKVSVDLNDPTKFCNQVHMTSQVNS